MTEISMRGLTKTFGGTHVLRGVDLEIKGGELMVFVGPSGSGKSTVLRVLSGLEDITSGELSFDGERMNDVPPPKRGIAMVFQSYALYPHMTVRQNLGFALRMGAMGKAEIEERVGQAAGMLQIGALLDRYPRQLSGGQRQRVAIGRAIVRKPNIFLFDEPLSNLDASLRVATRLEIAQLHQRLAGTTMIYVTHDQVEAMTLADRICVLRDGQVEQVGTPAELYGSPRTQFVAGFIGSPKMNFLTGESAARFGCATLGIRPEHIELSAQHGDLAGALRHVENLGADRFLFIDAGQSELVVVRQAGRDAHPPSTDLHLTFAREFAHRFDADGMTMTDDRATEVGWVADDRDGKPHSWSVPHQR